MTRSVQAKVDVNLRILLFAMIISLVMAVAFTLFHLLWLMIVSYGCFAYFTGSWITLRNAKKDMKE